MYHDYLNSRSALHPTLVLLPGKSHGQRWPKYWSFSFNISPSNEHPGLISFRIDWLDHLAVQGTLKSLLQHHSSKASILQRSAFFTVQLSHPYMATRKTIALTRLLLSLVNTWQKPSYFKSNQIHWSFSTVNLILHFSWYKKHIQKSVLEKKKFSESSSQRKIPMLIVRHKWKFPLWHSV